ncbi:DUF1998 domain-containing protein [Clostridium gasigenes]|uniref:DUF1998 domain-containing protein n=1 Tax=Clostridium gasigenes TaxID=94869 RepID=UPI001C0DC677|nr:DUF1998 domain-containing protein [Clostridium gasigenes]MBU3109483.1 DUF1998 domain-containing protein [Clostridium gasigenes]
MNNDVERERLHKNNYNVRLSQIITTFGPGAIMDFKEQPLMVATPLEWLNPKKIYDERLAKRLGVDCFKYPGSEESGNGVPFVRFPNWYYCSSCKEFKKIDEWENEYFKEFNKFMQSPVCINHINNKGKRYGIKLVAPSILVACKNGHIDDFPWVEWAHLNKKEKCNDVKLKIESNSGNLGLAGFNVKCKCGASNNLKLAFQKNVFKILNKPYINERDEKGPFTCKGKLQWSGKREKCNIEPQTVLRNASNIYFSKIETSLIIPPYSEEINNLIDESENFDLLKRMIVKQEIKGKLEEFIELHLEEYVEDIAEDIRKQNSISVITDIVKRKISVNEEMKKNRNDYRFEEYNALTGVIKTNDTNSKDFKIEIKDGIEYNIKEISQVTLVERLREVRSLVGFSRIKPPDNFVMGIDPADSSGEDIEENDLRVIDIGTKPCGWYPAYEVRGEGIFIKLKSNMIEEWILNHNEIGDRAREINKKYSIEFGGNSERVITAKFILLHTLAHLLIKELSFECGYSTTSLRERIYSDIPNDNYEMSGILIYTADSDSEGSLGGLVKQGDSSLFPKIFKNSIKKAKWCSYDPVCINSHNQGFRNLNLAACYSCTLLPETSCEEFNILLDRAMIVGTLRDKEIGFFKDYL